MTDEEIAEEYKESRRLHCVPKERYVMESQESRLTEIKQAFLAGLRAGKPKWHKVADGDYPPCEKGNYTINVLTDCGDIAYYDYNENCWIVEPTSAEMDPPVAWCEIPKYTEE